MLLWHKNCPGSAWIRWKTAQGINLASNFHKSQSNQTSVRYAKPCPILGSPPASKWPATMPGCQMLMHWDVGNLKAKLMPWTLSLTLLGSFLCSFCGLYCPAGGNCFHKWMHTVCSSAWVCGACRITSTWTEAPKFPSRSLHCDKTINVIHFACQLCCGSLVYDK